MKQVNDEYAESEFGHKVSARASGGCSLIINK